MNILEDLEDSEECVNDTMLGAWNSIPPQRPLRLSLFLGKITRNLALNRIERKNAKKRGGNGFDLVFEELSECIPDTSAEESEDSLLKEAIESFLRSLPDNKRFIFIRRYWYMDTIGDIAKATHLTESNVKVTLSRLRTSMKEFLEKEGVSI
jgi:RNA polymerase sigma-70 factor (ECF subfamily)